jgi:DNA-3-methyladenine glycosylase I
MARCTWCGQDPIYVDYHDHVWGRPQGDSLHLFEKLCLDGQQAGLSWITVLKKQANYQRLFAQFQPTEIVLFDDAKVESLMQDAGIIRNRLKIHSIIRNANAYLKLESEGVVFSEFLWAFVGGAPLQNSLEAPSNIIVTSPESDAMSKALKKAGFNFVGSTIVYAFMQAVGMVNDHLVSCPQHSQCAALADTLELT